MLFFFRRYCGNLGQDSRPWILQADLQKLYPQPQCYTNVIDSCSNLRLGLVLISKFVFSYGIAAFWAKIVDIRYNKLTFETEETLGLVANITSWPLKNFKPYSVDIQSIRNSYHFLMRVTSQINRPPSPFEFTFNETIIAFFGPEDNMTLGWLLII